MNPTGSEETSKDTEPSVAKRLAKLEWELEWRKKKLASLMDEEGNLPAEVQLKVEKLLMGSPFVSQLRSGLVALVAVGIAVWLGGTVYQGIELKSIRDAEVKFESDLVALKKEDSTAEEKLRQYLDSSAADAKKQIAGILNDVEIRRAGAARDIEKSRRSVVDTSNRIVGDINARAKQVTDLLSAPDLVAARGQIEKMSVTAGKVNWSVLRAFLHWTWYLAVTLSVVCAGLCLAMWIRVRPIVHR